jgi:hypothetical protein
VAAEHVAGPEHQHYQRGAHAGVLRVGACGFEDGTVGLPDAQLHGTAHFLVGGRVRGFVQPAAELVAQLRGEHAAGNLAGVVAAHAVGQHRQRRGLVQRHRILVVAARAAGIDGAEELGVHGVLGVRRHCAVPGVPVAAWAHRASAARVANVASRRNARRHGFWSSSCDASTLTGMRRQTVLSSPCHHPGSGAN